MAEAVDRNTTSRLDAGPKLPDQPAELPRLSRPAERSVPTNPRLVVTSRCPQRFLGSSDTVPEVLLPLQTTQTF